MDEQKFIDAFDNWLVACQKLIDDEFSKNYPNLDVPTLQANVGRKYMKVIKVESQRSVFAFIDLSNGDVLKPAGWSRPAKHARGNLFDDEGGMGQMTSYGPKYLR
jgi:hypothetical protein